MNGALILLVVLAIPYLAFNVRRLYRGRAWAFGLCQVAKEWEQRERDKRIAARCNGAPPAGGHRGRRRANQSQGP